MEQKIKTFDFYITILTETVLKQHHIQYIAATCLANIFNSIFMFFRFYMGVPPSLHSGSGYTGFAIRS
jgi:hypothetical protein